MNESRHPFLLRIMFSLEGSYLTENAYCEDEESEQSYRTQGRIHYS